MYYEAVKAAFNLFPLDPPGNLSLGDYVRIGRGGRVLHFGNLGQLLNHPIEKDETSHSVEYFGEGVVKAGAAGDAVGLAQANVAFSSRPGLYIRGRRTVYRIRNIESLLNRLTRGLPSAWKLRYRIVVETQVVEHADVCCSRTSAADVRVRYDHLGSPVSVDAEYARQQTGLLHLPDVTGTIAFGAIRYLPLIGVLHGNAPRLPFEYGALNVNEPEDWEDDLSEV